MTFEDQNENNHQSKTANAVKYFEEWRRHETQVDKKIRMFKNRYESWLQHKPEGKEKEYTCCLFPFQGDTTSPTWSAGPFTILQYSFLNFLHD